MKQINNYFKLVLFTLALFSSQNIMAQCTDWLEPTPTTVWGDLDAAPCNDGSGCTAFEITGFEVFAAEAYGITDVIAGNSYAFSICNSPAGAGMGGQAWNVDFTIIAPSGVVDAFGVDADNCTISWTATEDGTYVLVVNEAGNCGGGTNTMTANGYPSINCTGDSPCPTIPCSVSIADNEDGTATANVSNGVEPFTYSWSNGGMMQTTMGLVDGETYMVSVTDAEGCMASSSITIGAGGTACESWAAPANMGVYSDFSTQFGGAPCDSGDGCPVNEIVAFEVFASEAYQMENILLGGTYIFSICNGPDGVGTGGQAWIPDFTIFTPSGAIDTFGLGDDGCSITWTASEEGTYVVVVNEAGSCGGGANTGTGNGYPSITCSGDTPCPPIPPCFASTLVDNNAQIVCGDEGTFSIGVNTATDTVPESGGYGWVLTTSQGGTGGLGGDFNILSASGTGADVYNSDLGGILSGATPAQGGPYPPLEGTWVFKSFVYFNDADPFNSICSISDDSVFIFFSDISVDFIFDNNNNTASVIASGPNEPFTYLWSEGSTGSTTDIIDETGTYSVMITDALGCTTVASVDVSSTVAIEDVESLVNFKINPNPTSGDFNIHLELDQVEDIQIDLMTITGKKVKNIASEASRGNMYSVKANELPAGLYFVNFQVGAEQFTEKLIIQ